MVLRNPPEEPPRGVHVGFELPQNREDSVVGDRNAIRIEEGFQLVGVRRFGENVGDEDVVGVGVCEDGFGGETTETRV